MSTCLVSAKDFKEHFLKGGVQSARDVMPAPKYAGPERRKNQHDRRFYAGQGGRRTLDRKS